MPLDATRNVLVLPILGLLVEQPAHAYDLAVRVDARYPHLKARRSSVVTLVKSLAAHGLLRPDAPVSVANRPARTTYRLTDTGVTLFRSRVREGLDDATPASTDFLMAVAYLGILSTTDAITALRTRAERLQRETPTIPPELPEIQMIETHYWLRVLATEITWLTETADRLAAGDLEVVV